VFITNQMTADPGAALMFQVKWFYMNLQIIKYLLVSYWLMTLCFQSYNKGFREEIIACWLEGISLFSWFFTSLYYNFHLRRTFEENGYFPQAGPQRTLH
jgi:hypothetical protein